MISLYCLKALRDVAVMEIDLLVSKLLLSYFLPELQSHCKKISKFYSSGLGRMTWLAVTEGILRPVCCQKLSFVYFNLMF